MAYDSTKLTIGTLVAAADLSTKQYYLVKLSAANTVNVCAATTDIPIGVLTNKPAAGEACEITFFGVEKVKCGAGITAGNTIGTDNSGLAVAKTPGTDVGDYKIGQAITTSSNSGEFITAIISCPAAARLTAT